MKNLTLSDDEYNLLILALGFATGVCMKDGMQSLAEKIIELYSKIYAEGQKNETNT